MSSLTPPTLIVWDFINKSDLYISVWPSWNWGWLCFYDSAAVRDHQCVDMTFHINWAYNLRAADSWGVTPLIIQECLLLLKSCSGQRGQLANQCLKPRITKQPNPFIGQAYKGDSGSKSGLKCWTDGMECATVRVVCVFFKVCLTSSKRQQILT